MNARILLLTTTVALGLALFTMVWAGLHWTWLATLLGLAVGALGGWGLWQFGLRQQTTPTQVGLERLAMKLAWRQGGWLLPADLDPLGLTVPQAQQLLQTLAQRGLCQPEGEGYRFYSGR